MGEGYRRLRAGRASRGWIGVRPFSYTGRGCYPGGGSFRSSALLPAGCGGFFLFPCSRQAAFCGRSGAFLRVSACWDKRTMCQLCQLQRHADAAPRLGAKTRGKCTNASMVGAFNTPIRHQKPPVLLLSGKGRIRLGLRRLRRDYWHLVPQLPFLASLLRAHVAHGSLRFVKGSHHASWHRKILQYRKGLRLHRA